MDHVRILETFWCSDFLPQSWWTCNIRVSLSGYSLPVCIEKVASEVQEAYGREMSHRMTNSRPDGRPAVVASVWVYFILHTSCFLLSTILNIEIFHTFFFSFLTNSQPNLFFTLCYIEYQRGLGWKL